MSTVHPLPSAEAISRIETKERPLPIEPWLAAGLSRLWQGMKKHIQASIVADSLATGQANSSGTPSSAGTQVQPQTVQSRPASAHNHS